MVAEPQRSTMLIRVRPARGWVPLRFRELWEFRDLLYFLVQRDVKVRYKQTVLGIAWAVLQPTMTMVVFSLLFGRIAQLPSEGIPYPLFTFAALLPWQLFAYALQESSNSLVANQALISKVYFPRVITPIAAVMAGLVDFGIAFGVLVALMIYYGVTPTWGIVALPVLVLFAVATALAVGLWLSALNVKYRDVRYTIPFLTQLWLFVTPIAYSTSLVPDSLRPIFALNPMTGVVEGFRWALLGTDSAPGPVVLLSVAVVLILLTGGLFYFRRMERTFADVV